MARTVPARTVVRVTVCFCDWRLLSDIHWLTFTSTILVSRLTRFLCAAQINDICKNVSQTRRMRLFLFVDY